ncbi:MAG: aminotransferase DegT [Desulfuromonas sp.]|nr:MAG: aminotransferase DegT [Desulfuromonas sp.]
MMHANRYHIPQLQPLPPSILVNRPAALSSFYPFNAVDVYYYYLARNALWNGIDLLGLSPGDEVLMPAYHHGVEVETLLRKGLKLRYYRIGADLQVDFDHLREILTERTRCLYAIHYFGFPQSNEKLSAFARQHQLLYIEDCALALLSGSEEQPLGMAGDLSIFCLYKTLPVPHGGLLVMNRSVGRRPAFPDPPDLLSTASCLGHRLLDNVGLISGTWPYRITQEFSAVARAVKHRLGRPQAQVDSDLLQEDLLPVGISQLTRHILRRLDLEAVKTRRQENYRLLSSLLEGVVERVFPELLGDVCPLFFPVCVEDKAKVHRELNTRGVESVYFWSKKHPDVPVDMFPEVNRLRDHLLELPIHQGMSRAHVEYVAEKVREVV